MTKWEKILADHPRIVLCGRSNVGKSKLADQAEGRLILCTDYERFGGDCPNDITFSGQAYHFLERLMAEGGPWLLEGTQAARIVRAGLRDHKWEPDAVVHVVGLYPPDEPPDADLPQDDIEEAHRLATRRIGAARSHDTIWGGYLELREAHGASAVLYEMDETEMAEEV